jgi:hypothetical protein
MLSENIGLTNGSEAVSAAVAVIHPRRAKVKVPNDLCRMIVYRKSLSVVLARIAQTYWPKSPLIPAAILIFSS